MTTFSTCELSALCQERPYSSVCTDARMPSPSRGLMMELRMSHAPKHLSMATLNSFVRTQSGAGLAAPPCETRTPWRSVLEPGWLSKRRPDLLSPIIRNAKSGL